MSKHLTSAAVSRLRPGRQRREIRDGGCRGLLLIIQPSGHKSWAMRISHRGHLRRMVLGPVDISGEPDSGGEPQIGAPLTLAAARRLAVKLNHERASGKDVAGLRHREMLEREARGAATFAVAALDFVEQHAKRHTRGWPEKARLLGLDDDNLALIPKGLSDRWRDVPIAEITGDDVHLVVAECRERGVPGLERRADGPTESQAMRMYATLSKLFGWLVEQRRIAVNPVAGVARPKTLAARDRVLTDAEIKKFWTAAEAERTEFSAALKLLLLTGQRLNEVAEMRRSELSDDRATWTIPGDRTKNKRVHVVPLPPLAREIIGEAMPASGSFVFTTNGGATAIAVGSKIKARLDAAMRVPPWRVHDLRRTAATGMAELGIAPHVVEAVLNHVSGAKAGVAGTCNRAAYAPEKKAALERWAANIASLVSGTTSNVVPLRVS